MKRSIQNAIVLTCIALVSLAGAALAFLNTTNGPWGFSDPVAYLSTARSIAAGRGIGYFEADAEFTPFTIQPPFYSIVLSLPAWLNLDMVASARWLNISAYAALLFLAGWTFWRFSRAPWIGIAVSAVLCVFPHLFVMGISAYTEPLFLLLFMGGGACLLAYLQKDRDAALVAGALLLGLTAVTRYVGVGLIAAGALSVWTFSRGRFWDRTKNAFLFSLIAGLPIALWFTWVYFSDAGTLGGRNLEADWGAIAEQFRNFRGIFMDTVWKWLPFQDPETLLRYRTRFIISGVGLAGILVLCLLAEKRLRRVEGSAREKTGWHIFSFFGLASICLLAVLLATYLFTFPTIDIDNRTLLPLYLGGSMSIFGVLALWQAAWFKGRVWFLRLLPWVLAALCIAWYIPQLKERIEFYKTGTGLTAFAWEDSSLVDAVRSLPVDQPVIANEWELLLLWTERPIHSFWSTFPVEAPLQTGAYGTQESDPNQVLFCQDGAALVIFNSFRSQASENLESGGWDQIVDLFTGVTVFGTYDDGKIYLCP